MFVTLGYEFCHIKKFTNNTAVILQHSEKNFMGKNVNVLMP